MEVKDYSIKPVSDKNAITIVFAPDNNYCKYFSVALQSLIANAAPDRFYDIIVFSTDISHRNKKMIFEMLPSNFSLRFFDVSGFIKEKLGNFKLTAKNHWSINTFYRLFIPILMKDYEKVLYLDSDICILDSLTELFDTDFEGKQMIAVKDCDTPVFYKDKKRVDQILNILKMQKTDNYFNAGMTFFNVKNIEVTKYMDKLIDVFKITKLFYLDQDILNVIFENTTKLVSCKWNFQYHIPIYHPDYLNIITGKYKEDFIASGEKPCIIHYTSEIKPWSYPKEAHAEYFWKYARKSPFYEEILFDNLVAKSSLKYFWQRNKISLNLLKCEWFSKITTGAKRLHYEAKAVRYSRMLKELQGLK